MGSKYERNNEQSGSHSITLTSDKKSHTLVLQHIRSTLPIGNTLRVNMRQQEGKEVSWVRIINSFTQTSIEFAPDFSQVPAGPYDVFLESFDDASSVKTTLFTDTVKVTIKETKESKRPKEPEKPKW